MRRDWGAANLKRGPCRICGAIPTELAHIAGRRHDKPRFPGTSTAYVKPESVLPLCPHHHRLFDAHKLDLLAYLEVEEQVQAVLDLGGIENARIRLEPSAYENKVATMPVFSEDAA